VPLAEHNVGKFG